MSLDLCCFMNIFQTHHNKLSYDVNFSEEQKSMENVLSNQAILTALQK